MKFSIGDKILVKETEEEGYIVSFIGKDMAEVKVGKLSFPVYLDDIDHPYLKWFTDKKKNASQRIVPEQLPIEKQQQKTPRLARGVYMSFFPEFKIEEMEDVVDCLKVHILNELPYEIQYQYSLNFAGQPEFKHEGKLQAFGHVYLHNVPFEDMNDGPRFMWKIDNLEDADMQPMDGVLKIKPQKLFQHIQDVLANNKPSFSYLLFEDFSAIDKFAIVELTKRKVVKKTIEVKAKEEEAKYELDLHIEKILTGYSSLTNSEIIDVQVNELEKYVRLAINNHQENMMVIHGIGKGRLREEVHKYLASIPEVFSYANDWHSKYGFGATEVKFKY